MVAKQKHLQAYRRAVMALEKLETAISIIEQLNNCEVLVKQMKKKQMRELQKMDAAAAALGAPYEGGSQ